MNALLSAVAAAIAYVCVSTVISGTIGLSYLYSTGRLNPRTAGQIVQLLQGTELVPAKTEEKPEAEALPKVSIDQILEARLKRTMEIDIRESHLSQGLTNLRGIYESVLTNRTRYNELKEGFDLALKQLEEQWIDSGITDVQQKLEQMSPEQAKEQIKLMLERDEMPVVVAIVNAMPVNRSKKIIAQFQSKDEAEQLSKILEQLRLGVPRTTLIQDTRRRLAEFEAKVSKGAASANTIR